MHAAASFVPCFTAEHGIDSTCARDVPLHAKNFWQGCHFVVTTFLQGVAAARNAWKKRNLKPETKKEEKRARPTGRGDGALGPPGGRRGGPPAARGGRQGGVRLIPNLQSSRWLHVAVHDK